MDSYWVTLRSSSHHVVMRIRGGSGRIEFVDGKVFPLGDMDAPPTEIKTLRDLGLYGFEFPFYMADIEDSIREQDEEEKD